MKHRIIILFSIPYLLFGCSRQADKKLNIGTTWAVGSFDAKGGRLTIPKIMVMDANIHIKLADKMEETEYDTMALLTLGVAF